MVDPNVNPSSPVEEQPTIGLIGMGSMGKMYANYLSGAGWKKYVTRALCDHEGRNLEHAKFLG